MTIEVGHQNARGEFDSVMNKLLAVIELNPYQFPNGKSYQQAWKDAYNLAVKSGVPKQKKDMENL